MDRLVLTDGQWGKSESLCLGKPGDPGRSGTNDRLFVEAVLWIARTGSVARLATVIRPLEQRFHALSRLGQSRRVQAAVRRRLNPDMEYAMVDSTIVKVHRHGQSAKGDQAIGRSKGGMTTKILALTRCAGQPHPFCPSAGTALRYGLCSAAAPMPNQDRRTILSRQHALGRDYRFRQRCQWVLDGCGIEPRCLQSCNHLGPA
jgi:transposase